MIVTGRFVKVKLVNYSRIVDSAPAEQSIDDGTFSNSTLFPVGSIDFIDSLNGTKDAPPEQLTVDYVEMAILIVMVLVGGPLNFVSLFRSIRSNPPRFLHLFGRIGEMSSGTKRRSWYLKVNLTIANLLVIWVYALSDLCWLATYDWRGGDFMCRVVRFVHAFCFYATSNLMTTIAIQRLSVAMNLDRPPSRRITSNARLSRPVNRYHGGRNRGWDRTRLAYGAWTLAFVCSLPQLVIWRVFELYPGWEQCVTTWTIEKYLLQKSEEREEEEMNDSESEKQEKMYNGFHLAFVFWLPVLIICVCYVLIVSRFQRRIRKQARQIEAEANAEVESRAENVRATLALGGPVDADSPLLLPIAIFRTLQYQTIQSDEAGSSKSVPVTQQRRVSCVKRKKDCCSCCFPYSGNKRYSTTSADRVDAFVELDKTGYLSTASILNATLIGAGRPYVRKSFAMATLSRAKRRTMKKTIWILLSYLLCWSPYNVLVLWRYIDRDVDLYDFEIMYNLIVLNAVVNPLIYGI